MAPLRTRSGTTLTEVLMSLMIMSIGIVLVATLFPVSTMRALEANRSTNSTIARFVAEALIDVDPLFVHDPDGTFPNLGVGGSPGETSYNTSFAGTNYLVDPLGWQTFNQTTPAVAPFGLPVPFSNRDYFGSSPPVGVTLPMLRRYTGASMFPNPYPAPTAINDINSAVVRASQLVTQPDNWKLVTEDLASVTGSSVVLNSDADLSSIKVSLNSGVFYRIVLFDVAGVQSQVRMVTDIDIANNRVIWTEDDNGNGTLDPTEDTNGNGVLDGGEDLDSDGVLDPGEDWNQNGIIDDYPLPSSFIVARARVEVSDDIYTWMLSVRKRRVYDDIDFNRNGIVDPGDVDWNGNGLIDIDRVNVKPNVDVVVFFRRAITDLQEQVYEANFQPNADNRVVVSFISPMPEPTLKRGGYVFDTMNALWFRIAKIENETAYSADLLLDESIKQVNYVDANGNGVWNAGELRGGAILHPQVVNVFPLQIKEP